MIVKLANLIIVQKTSDKQDVSGPSSLLGYYSHPAVLAGGIAGGTVMGEALEHFLPDKKHIDVTRVGGKKLFNIHYGGTLKAELVKSQGAMKRRILWNVGRGLLSSVGAGIAATGVAAYRKRKDESTLPEGVI